MQRAFDDPTGCADLISRLLEARSWLLYRAQEPASEAISQLARWLQSRHGVLDTTLVERIQQELTPEFLANLETAYRLLEEAGMDREAAAVDPFVRLFPGMIELRDACLRMQQSYAQLLALTGRRA